MQAPLDSKHVSFTKGLILEKLKHITIHIILLYTLLLYVKHSFHNSINKTPTIFCKKIAHTPVPMKVKYCVVNENLPSK